MALVTKGGSKYKRRNENGSDVAHWYFFKADMKDQEALANRIEQAISDGIASAIDRLTLNDLDKIRARFP
jgi:hypothetical protein